MQKHNFSHAPAINTESRNVSGRRLARLLSSASSLGATGLIAAALFAIPVQLDFSGVDQIVTLDAALAASGPGSGASGDGDDDGGSGSGSGASDGDNTGPGSGGDDNDSGNSGPGPGNDDNDGGGNSGPGSRGDNDENDDDRDDDDNGDRHDGDGNGNNAARPEIPVDLSQSDLTAVLNGDKILVDNLGRVLELEIDVDNGVTKVTAKPHGGDAQRNPGPIDSFTIVTP